MEQIKAFLGVGGLNDLIDRFKDGFERSPDASLVIDQEHTLLYARVTAVF
jgi:hypothetical protein